MHKCTNQPAFTTFKWILACSDCPDLIHLDKSNLLHLDPRLDTLASESTIYIVFISWQAATECWLHVTWPSVEVVVSLRSASVKWPNKRIHPRSQTRSKSATAFHDFTISKSATAWTEPNEHKVMQWAEPGMELSWQPDRDSTCKKMSGKCDFPCVFADWSVMQVFWAFVLSISAQSVHEPLFRFRLFSMFFRFNRFLFRKQLWSWLFDSLFNLISMSCPKINILSNPEGWRVPVSFVLHWTQIKKLRSRRVPGHKFILGSFERMKWPLYGLYECRMYDIHDNTLHSQN